MWEKYKSAIITGGVLACVMFFAIGYTVGHDSKGGMMSAGMQSPNIQNEEGCRKDFGGRRGRHGFPGNRQDPAGSTEDNQQDSQGSTDGQQTPPDVNTVPTPPQGNQNPSGGASQDNQGSGSGTTEADPGSGSGTTQDKQGTTQSPAADNSIFLDGNDTTL